MPKCSRQRKSHTSYHTLADHVLQKRAAAGDEEAWLALFQRYTLDQMVTQSEGSSSSLEYCLGDDLWLHFEKCDNVVKMFVEINSKGSLEKIKAHSTEIQILCDRLDALQGPWSAGGRELLFLELHMRHLRDESYQDLADLLNIRIAEALVSWKDQQDAEHAFVAQFRGRSCVKGDFSGYGEAAVLLRAMGFDEEEIMTYCESALENIAGKKPAFLPGEPISRDQVISRLRAWRERHRQWLSPYSNAGQAQNSAEIGHSLL
jgi:hypothetical protein